MMTALKNKFLPLLTLVFGLGLMSEAFAQRAAVASRMDTVPSIRINNTSSLHGRYIHVLYAIGRRLPLEMTRFPQLDIVRAANSVLISGSSVQFPGLTLEKITFRGSYNMIVIVSSNSPEIKWANPEDSVRIDYSLLNIIEKSTVDTFIGQQGPEAVFSFSL